mgnify:CR=1 FL=1
MEVTDMIWYLNGFLGEKKSKKKCIGKGAAKTKTGNSKGTCRYVYAAGPF